MASLAAIRDKLPDCAACVAPLARMRLGMPTVRWRSGSHDAACRLLVKHTISERLTATDPMPLRNDDHIA
jgi:hypothetical protein